MVSSMSGWLCDAARHGNTKMLLSHLCLLWKLEAARLGDIEILHLALQILLVRCRNLLLLLLQHLNLLGKSQLLHHQGRHL